MADYAELDTLIGLIADRAVVAEMVQSGWEANTFAGVVTSSFEKYDGPEGLMILHWDGTFEYHSLDTGGFDAPAPPPDGFGHKVYLQSLKAKWDVAIRTLFEPYLDLPDPADFTEEETTLSAPLGKLSAGHFVNSGTPSDSSAVDDPADGAGGQENLTGHWVDNNPAIERLGLARDEIFDWHGPAADSFRRSFLNPIPEATERQFWTVVMMQRAVRQEGELWRSARSDIAQVADAAFKAMAECGRSGSGHEGLALAIFGTLTTVVSAMVPPAALALSLTASATGILSALSEDSHSVSGSSPDQVYESLVKEVQTINDAVAQGEGHIADVMTALTNEMRNNRGEFHPGEATRFLNTVDASALDTNGFRVDTDRLTTVARWLMTASNSYRDASQGLYMRISIFSRPDSVGSGTYGPAYAIDGTMDALREILTDVAFFVDETGEHVKICATLYDDVDAKTVEARLRQHAKEVDARHDAMVNPPILPDSTGDLPPHMRYPGVDS